MKRLFTLFMLIGLHFSVFCQGNYQLFQENYNSSSGWNLLGSVSVNNGKFNFNGCACQSYNKGIKDIGFNLSDQTFKAKFSFNLSQTNNSGEGVGHILLAMTSDSVDFVASIQNNSFIETTNDGIAVALFSDDLYNNNVNDWKFIIESKDGNQRTFTSTGIHAIDSISNYYVCLERINLTSVKLSIYSDSAYTQHLPGSPLTTSLNSGISNLRFIQHGSITSGTNSRKLHGEVDDLTIESGIVNTCSATLLNDDLSSVTGWTTMGNVTLDNNLTFSNCEGGEYHKAYKTLGRNLSDSYWKTEIKLSLGQNNPENGVAATVIAVTADTHDFSTTSLNDGLQATDQDGISAVLFSESMYDNDVNNWLIKIVSKKGTVKDNSTSNISIDTTYSDLYIRLERLSVSESRLSVFSDSLFSVNLPGSPVIMSIDSTISSLNVFQTGSLTEGSYHRVFNGTIDNIDICDNGIFINDSIPEDTTEQPNHCTTNVFSDACQNSSGWNTLGDSHFSNGGIEFISAHCGSYNKAYKKLNRNLSNSYWKSEIKLTLNQNALDNGTAASVIAITADTLDFSRTSQAEGMLETNQDGLSAVLFSQSIYDNDIHNWLFKIESKKGNVRNHSASNISIDSTYNNLYVRLERLSESEVMLSVFSDTLFSVNLPGSPIIMNIDPSITSLNVFQTGALTEGSPQRVFSGIIDNIDICDNGLFVNDSVPLDTLPGLFECTNTFVQELFDSTGTWNFVGNVNMVDGELYFTNASGLSNNFAMLPLEKQISDDYFRAFVHFTLTDHNAIGEGVNFRLLTLSESTTSNLIGWDHHIGAVLESDSGDADISRWRFALVDAYEYYGFNYNKSSNVIPFDTSLNSFYVVIEKEAGIMRLRILNDLVMEISGSPIFMHIPENNSNFSSVTIGTPSIGYENNFHGKFDNLEICDNSAYQPLSESISLYPNPAQEGFQINNPMNLSLKSMSMADFNGTVVYSKDLNLSNQGETISTGDLTSGIYQVIVRTEDNRILTQRIAVIKNN